MNSNDFLSTGTNRILIISGGEVTHCHFLNTKNMSLNVQIVKIGKNVVFHKYIRNFIQHL